MRHESIISIKDATIVDAQEKKRVFRGTTLLRGEASSKLPSLQEVENLFAKMKKAGITMLRWQIAWEDLEPEPDSYNEAYLADLRTLLKQAETDGILVFVEPVMRNWGSCLGGCGAPPWTLRIADLEQESMDEQKRRETMFTLFWAGKKMAPACLVEGDNIQDYLQDHYIAAMKHAARRIKDCKTVVGFGIMAEGSPGDTKAMELFPLDFEQDCLKPFQKKYMAAFHKKHSHYLFLAEPTTSGHYSKWQFHPDYNTKEAATIQKEGGVIPDADSEAAKVITLLGCPTTQKKLLGMFSKDKSRSQFKDEIKKASGGGNAMMAEITSTQGTECILEVVQEEGLSYFVSMEMMEASSRT